MAKDWMKKIVDGGAENCEENMLLAVQVYSGAITEALNGFRGADLPIMCVALKNVLSVVLDSMDDKDIDIAAMFNNTVKCEGRLVKYEQNR